MLELQCWSIIVGLRRQAEVTDGAGNGTSVCDHRFMLPQLTERSTENFLYLRLRTAVRVHIMASMMMMMMGQKGADVGVRDDLSYSVIRRKIWQA
mmetsp:Transcript_27724/g.59210  ORF Transcript_27724/g.59210 Transcript_27724/m.59210 type:complete len:95 (+) Transcript_27724:731-1015(+)